MKEQEIWHSTEEIKMIQKQQACFLEDKKSGPAKKKIVIWIMIFLCLFISIASIFFNIR